MGIVQFLKVQLFTEQNYLYLLKLWLDKIHFVFFNKQPVNKQLRAQIFQQGVTDFIWPKKMLILSIEKL